MKTIEEWHAEIEKRSGERDVVAVWREVGLWVPASHCPSCGRWAHVHSGNDSTPGYYWMVTDCAKCGRWEIRGGPAFMRRMGDGDITVKKLEET